MPFGYEGSTLTMPYYDPKCFQPWGPHPLENTLNFMERDAMPRPDGDKCAVCGERFNPEAYPFCSYCQSFLVEIEDLDLSPQADLVTIFRKRSEVKH